MTHSMSGRSFIRKATPMVTSPKPSQMSPIIPNGDIRQHPRTGKTIRQWREVRDALGLPDVSSHSFGKTVAALIDDSGLSARIGADQLGQARPSMTQDVYMSRGQVHTEVVDVLDKAVGINDEKTSSDVENRGGYNL
jgi:integrase